MTADEIREMWQILSEHQGSKWVRIAEMHAITGLSATELAEIIRNLIDTDPRFRAEPEPFGFRITDEDRQYAVTVGGEPRHMIGWV